MQKFLILLLMMVCLFGPMAIFAWAGNKALSDFGRRPSEGAKVMVPFILKLMGAAFAAIGILMILLKVFGPESGHEPVYRFKDMDWRILK